MGNKKDLLEQTLSVDVVELAGLFRRLFRIETSTNGITKSLASNRYLSDTNVYWHREVIHENASHTVVQRPILLTCVVL